MKKSYIISFLISAMVVIFYGYSNDMKQFTLATEVYKVYIGGTVLGNIESDEELYELINKEQQAIKDKYGVDTVYPPSDFNIVKINTYNPEITDVQSIYKQIEDKDNFTIEGYEVHIKNEEEDHIIVNILNEDTFDNTMDNFIKAFIDSKMYADYMNGEQDTLEDSKLIVDDMYFRENISIKKAYISVEETIYTDESALLQYLIFNEGTEMLEYKIQAGDTIESVADEHKLHISEFLIGNPDYRDINAMLQINEKVNVTLPVPIINFVYKVTKIEQIESDYTNTNVVDKNQTSSYSEITTPGITGLENVTMEYEVINGMNSQNVEIIQRETLRETVNQVTTVGQTVSSGGWSSSNSSTSLATGLQLTSPVKSGFIVTAPFGEWRGYYAHQGTDFSGTGYNSAIYSIASGVVTQAADASCRTCAKWAYGTYVVISHGNNYYSIYMHMVTGSLKVKVGDTVSMGQQIGGMGSTGQSTGTHLHLGFSVGEPSVSGSITYYDPYKLIFGS